MIVKIAHEWGDSADCPLQNEEAFKYKSYPHSTAKMTSKQCARIRSWVCLIGSNANSHMSIWEKAFARATSTSYACVIWERNHYGCFRFYYCRQSCKKSFTKRWNPVCLQRSPPSRIELQWRISTILLESSTYVLIQAPRYSNVSTCVVEIQLTLRVHAIIIYQGTMGQDTSCFKPTGTGWLEIPTKLCVPLGAARRHVQWCEYWLHSCYFYTFWFYWVSSASLTDCFGCS